MARIWGRILIPQYEVIIPTIGLEITVSEKIEI